MDIFQCSQTDKEGKENLIRLEIKQASNRYIGVRP